MGTLAPSLQSQVIKGIPLSAVEKTGTKDTCKNSLLGDTVLWNLAEESTKLVPSLLGLWKGLQVHSEISGYSCKDNLISTKAWVHGTVSSCCALG